MHEKIIQAVWQNVVIASSADTIELEGNHYFLVASVNMQYLEPSINHTRCSWKGDASYYHLQVGEMSIADAAWFYPYPLPEASAIEGRVAFWRGVEAHECTPSPGFEC